MCYSLPKSASAADKMLSFKNLFSLFLKEQNVNNLKLLTKFESCCHQNMLQPKEKQ